MPDGISLDFGQTRTITKDRVTAVERKVPWYIWCAFAATCSAMIGGIWDISWHKSIGRDSFWTPAHVLIYLCGVLAGIACGWLILNATFRADSPLRAASVRLFGLRAPLGAFLCAWGGLAMLVSAPFDDWWHNAYGLDVKVLSPPHVVLIFGLLTIRFGALVLILSAMNRAGAVLRGKLEWLFLFLGATLVGGAMGAFLEQIVRNYMHSARFYRIVAIVVPLLLVAAARASGRRCAATIMAGMIAAVSLLSLWITPLFPATPRLGPVYQNITHMIPANDFPLLIFVASLALDWALARGWSAWKTALAGGPAFLALFIAAQWPFANFLMSDASRNWFFGTHYYPFFAWSGSDYTRGLFTAVEKSPAEFWLGMGLAFALSILSTRLGFAWGNWMRSLQR
jgi:hypothetical protein